MSDSAEDSGRKEEVKSSIRSCIHDSSSIRKPSSSSATGFRKSPSSLASTASSTGSDASKGQNKASDPSSGEADGAEDHDSKQKNQLELLASVSVATKSDREAGTSAEGESDSGTSDEHDTQDRPHKPQHKQEEAAPSNQQPPQQIPTNTGGPLPDAQLTQQTVLQALQRIINQPSNISQPPNMMLIQQLAQHLVNTGNPTIVPSQALGVFGSASNAAQLLLNQLPTNTNYQNSAPAMTNFIQKLQELIIQQQLAGNLSANPPTFNPVLANVAALLQQQNQLQQQQQLSSLLAMRQLTNPGQMTAASAFSMPQMAVGNPAAAMMNQASAPPPCPQNGLPPVVFEPTGRPALPLATDSDEENLAPYQCLLRKQIELFETREDDIYLKAQGRNTPIRVGQVGIRCRHCAAMAKSKRVEGSAVLYSKTVNGIYQVSLNMGRLHFLNNSCNMIPEGTKKQLAELKQLPRKVARGRQYWKETLETQGVIEEDEYLRFKSTSSSSS